MNCSEGSLSFKKVKSSIIKGTDVAITKEECSYVVDNNNYGYKNGNMSWGPLSGEAAGCIYIPGTKSWQNSIYWNTHPNASGSCNHSGRPCITNLDTARILNIDNDAVITPVTDCIAGIGYYKEGNKIKKCPDGSITADIASTSISDCNIADIGYYKEGNKIKKCPNRSTTSDIASTSISNCNIADIGYYKESNTYKKCPDGSTSNIGSTSISDCVADINYYKIDDNTYKKCPDGSITADIASTSISNCNIADIGYYKEGNNYKKCPDGSTTNIGSTSISDCFADINYHKIDDNTYQKCPDEETKIEVCGLRKGWYKSGHDEYKKCPDGTTTSKKNPTSWTDCNIVARGFYGNVNVTNSCPNGSTTENENSESITNCVALENWYKIDNNTYEKCPENSNTAGKIGSSNIDFCIADNDYYKSGSEIVNCPNGSSTFDIKGSTRIEDCIALEDWYKINNNTYEKCPENSNTAGKIGSSNIDFCLADNDYYNDGGNIIACPDNSTSDVGSTSFLNCISDEGFYNNGTNIISCPSGTNSLKGSNNISNCIPETNHYKVNDDLYEECPQGSKNNKQTSTSLNDCIAEYGYYNDGLAVTKCPENSNTIATGSTSISNCIANSNYYNDGNNIFKCPDNTKSKQGSNSYSDCIPKVGFEKIGYFIKVDNSNKVDECPEGSTKKFNIENVNIDLISSNGGVFVGNSLGNVPVLGNRDASDALQRFYSNLDNKDEIFKVDKIQKYDNGKWYFYEYGDSNGKTGYATYNVKIINNLINFNNCIANKGFYNNGSSIIACPENTKTIATGSTSILNCTSNINTSWYDYTKDEMITCPENTHINFNRNISIPVIGGVYVGKNLGNVPVLGNRDASDALQRFYSNLDNKDEIFKVDKIQKYVRNGKWYFYEDGKSNGKTGYATYNVKITRNNYCQSNIENTYHDKKTNTIKKCPPNTYSNINVEGCISNIENTWIDYENNEIKVCPKNHYCNYEVIKKECPQGKLSSINSTSISDCKSYDEIQLFKGYKVVESNHYVNCPGGKTSIPGATECIDCDNYPDNKCYCPPGYNFDIISKECTICDAGKYNDKVYGQCLTCPEGKYSSDTGSLKCKNCPVGSTAEDGVICNKAAIGYYREGTDFIKCQSGTTIGIGSESPDDCVNESGFYTKNNLKTKCDIGFYCINNSKFECPKGKTTFSTGSKSIYECIPKPGYIGSADGTNAIICRSNMYCTGEFNPMKTCPEKTSSNIGSTNINDCITNKKGYYGFGYANICPTGFYCPGNGEKKQCPVDSSITNLGSTSITNCKTTSVNKYIDYINKIVLDCPESRISLIGSGNIDSCNNTKEGWYNDGDIKNIDDDHKCPDNSKSEKGSTSFEECLANPGYYNDGSNIIACPSNSNTSVTGSTDFSNCIASIGYYNNNSNIIACPEGFSSNIGSTRQEDCIIKLDGYYYNSDKNAVEICTLGHYCNDHNKVKCEMGFFCLGGISKPKQCPKGKITSSTGQSECSICPSGKYEIDNIKCENCPANTYCTEGFQNPCSLFKISEAGSSSCNYPNGKKLEIVITNIDITNQDIRENYGYGSVALWPPLVPNTNRPHKWAGIPKYIPRKHLIKQIHTKSFHSKPDEHWNLQECINYAKQNYLREEGIYVSYDTEDCSYYYNERCAQSSWKRWTTQSYCNIWRDITYENGVFLTSFPTNQLMKITPILQDV